MKMVRVRGSLASPGVAPRWHAAVRAHFCPLLLITGAMSALPETPTGESISALSRSVEQAPSTLHSVEDSGCHRILVAGDGQYVPPVTLESAVQDAYLLSIGNGTSWQLAPAAASVTGETAPTVLTVSCRPPRHETVRAQETGKWVGALPPDSVEKTFSCLHLFVDMYLKLTSTVCLGFTPSTLPLVGKFVWIGDRYLGKDRQPDPVNADSPNLRRRNANALSMAATRIRGITLDKQPFSQPHVVIWRLAVPGKEDALPLGFHMSTAVYFLISKDIAHCAYSVEDLLAEALRQ